MWESQTSSTRRPRRRGHINADQYAAMYQQSIDSPQRLLGRAGGKICYLEQEIGPGDRLA